MAKKELLLSAVLVVLGLCASNAAFGFLGPPTAELKQGQWSAGYNYSYSTQDLDKTKSKWSYVDDGSSGSGTDELEVKDFKTQRHYATIGYGLTDRWEVYGSIGAADVKANARWTEVDGDTWTQGLNFDNDFAWGWGTKVTFSEQDKIAWGAALQMNWLDTSWSKKYSYSNGETGTVKDEIDIDTYDLLVTVGPTIDMGGWKLYGGPFYYLLNGDWDEKYTDNYTGEGSGTYIEKAKADLEEDSNFGGYIGAQLPIAQNCDFTTEVSVTGDGWGVAGGIAWKF